LTYEAGRQWLLELDWGWEQEEVEQWVNEAPNKEIMMAVNRHWDGGWYDFEKVNR
jgi:hypothetical protein